MMDDLKMDVEDGFDVASPELNERYADVVEEMVTRCPIAYSPAGKGFFVASRFKDVREIANDWETFTSNHGSFPNRPSFDDMMRMIPAEIDPPEQTTIRQAINKFFTKAKVEEKKESIRQIANEFIDTFVERGSCDLVEEFASPYPATVVFRLFLDVPEKDIAHLKEVADEGFLYMRTPESQAAAVDELHRFVEELLTTRERSGEFKGDVTDAILALTEPDGSPYPLWKKSSVLAELVLGGLQTTSDVLAGGFAHLAEHPQDQARLAADPSLMPAATEEFLRYYTPVFALGRTTQREVTVADRTIPAGESTLLAWGAANRDPEVFQNPRECIIDRSPNPHIAFGAGRHRCPGSHLARIMVTVAFEEFLRRVKDVRLSGDVRTTTTLLRHTHQVPVTFTAR